MEEKGGGDRRGEGGDRGGETGGGEAEGGMGGGGEKRRVEGGHVLNLLGHTNQL